MKKIMTKTASGHASYATRLRKNISDKLERTMHNAGTRAESEKKKYEPNTSFARFCVDGKQVSVRSELNGLTYGKDLWVGPVVTE